ncbi:MAG: hypothetical protein IPO92_19265 [Saprospiraceae bacterium]|nr:hypothetical protein [Saprospiraceae bacterium]
MVCRAYLPYRKFSLAENYLMENLIGLNNVTNIGGVDLYNGSVSLVSLEGLNNLTSVIGDFSISNYNGLPRYICQDTLNSVSGRLSLISVQSLPNILGFRI